MIPKETRNSFFEGKHTVYDQDYQTSNMYYGKEGPGPANINLRDGFDPLISFKGKKITSLKSGVDL